MKLLVYVFLILLGAFTQARHIHPVKHSDELQNDITFEEIKNADYEQIVSTSNCLLIKPGHLTYLDLFIKIPYGHDCLSISPIFKNISNLMRRNNQKNRYIDVVCPVCVCVYVSGAIALFSVLSISVTY